MFVLALQRDLGGRNGEDNHQFSRISELPIPRFLGLGRDPHCGAVGSAGEIGRKEIKGDKEEVL